MILPSFIDEALEQISETLSYNDDRHLDKAIDAWCDKLDFEHNETIEIKEIVQDLLKPQIKNDENNGIIDLCNNVIIFVGIPNNVLKTMKSINFKTFLLAVLGMVGIALVIKRLKPNKQKEFKRLRTENHNLPSAQIETNEYDRVLVLVIDASSINKFECFQSNLKILPSETEELYKSTRALWIGTKSEYFRSPLQNIFDNKYSLAQEEQSDSDVCFVKFKLKENHSGFEPNANPMDKLDAFKMLHKIAIEVNASLRLPSKSYQNTGVHLL